MPAPKMTAQQVRGYLYGHFTPRWAVLFEVTARPEGSLREKLQAAAAAGETQTVWATHRDRRIDALLVRRAPKRPAPSAAARAAEWNRQRADAEMNGTEPPPVSALFDMEVPTPPAAGNDGGIERVALEIKVSRGDFLADVRCPEKQAPWRELSNRHAYVCPAGLVRPDEVPKGSGLLEVTPGERQPFGQVRWVRKAPRSEAARPLPLPNLMDAFYRAARAEAVARGVDWQTRRNDVQDPETMRAELARLRHEMELLEGRVNKAEAREAEWRRRVAAFEPLPCATCGQPLRPALRRRKVFPDGGFVQWQHAGDEAEEACHVLRKALAETEAGADRRYLFVPGAEPLYPDEQTSCAVTG